jgi:hypothetical protein
MALDLYPILNRFAESLSGNFGGIFEATVIIIVGWFLGRVFGTLVKKILKAIRVDKYLKLEEGIEPSNVLPVLVSWIIYLVFIQAALNELGIAVLTVYFGSLVDMIQGLLGAFLILVVGYFIGKHGENYFKKKKHEYSKLVSQGVFLFTMIIALSIALEMVGLSTVLINSIILILVASFGLGLAIAIGLGLRDSVSRIAKKYEKKF